MSIESRLRVWAHRWGLQRSPLAVAAYRSVSLLRFRGRWDKPVQFRGARFIIGKDLSLFPSVRNGGFERDELDSVLPLVKDRDIVWDVGGNVGIYAALLARRATEGHVISFEPVPESRARLEANLALNAISNVTVEPIALSSVTGTAHMRVNPDAHGCDSIELEGDQAADALSLVTVATATAMDYLKRSPFGAPDVIKVDIEGHEPEFIEGAHEMLADRHPVLMMEVNPTTWPSAERVGRWSETLLTLFAIYGTAWWFSPHGRERVDHIDASALGPHAYMVLFGSGD